MGERVTAHLMLLPMSCCCCCCCGPPPSVPSFLLFLFVRLRLWPSLYAFSLMLWGFDTWTTWCPPRSTLSGCHMWCGVVCAHLSLSLPQLVLPRIVCVVYKLCVLTNSCIWYACKTNFQKINPKLSLGDNKIILKCYNLIRIKNLITYLDIQISTNTI